MINSAIGRSWDEVKDELFTVEENAASDFRVALIGEFIEVRQKKEYQKELAEICGVKSSVIVKMANGSTNLQLDTVLKVLAALGKTLTIVPLDSSDSKMI